jgi:hypothetical protein
MFFGAGTTARRVCTRAAMSGGVNVEICHLTFSSCSDSPGQMTEAECVRSVPIKQQYQCFRYITIRRSKKLIQFFCLKILSIVGFNHGATDKIKFLPIKSNLNIMKIQYFSQKITHFLFMGIEKSIRERDDSTLSAPCFNALFFASLETTVRS